MFLNRISTRLRKVFSSEMIFSLFQHVQLVSSGNGHQVCN